MTAQPSGVERGPVPGVPRWSVGGEFLEALAARDYERLAGTLDPGVRFRALLPPGPAEWEGRDEVAGVLRGWFGEAEEFQVVDVTVGEVGGRLHLAWRFRLRPAPFDIGDGWHVVEQHAFVDAGEAVESLSLLCSGFTVEAEPEASGQGVGR